MATLAMPVVVAEIGWVAMGLVDTLMVGPLGPGSDRRGWRRQRDIHGRRDLCDGAAARP